MTSGIEQKWGSTTWSKGVNSLHPVSSIEQHQQNIRPFQNSANLAPCTYGEGKQFRHVQGAKEEVQSIVKGHLRNLCRDFPLEHATFKEVARRSTHTILAACGIEHRSRMVAAPVPSPSNCTHAINDDESTYLMKGCCLSCFSSFVKDVVLKLVHTTSNQS
ncbi:uncharacterized protein LOC120108412 [Phoenix dactylifera]|uniref:Uncharacterized protein LOC120108412 n=1 Tax=Phoenix dactylifera TaxID=42345 RepID=A0A8B9A3M2_PHODC|nr:uncharacterized protein LOC120108412 [Phoenix dactylifera]